MRIHLLLLLILSILFGCKNDPNGNGDYTYFGGEIVNPNNDYVILNSINDDSDTLYLDNKNRFFHKIKDLQPGIYTFLHGGEYQLVLLEHKDSIMLRLNTMDFDESLVYTGEGARKNNFLISSFLENEVDNKKFMRMWEMEPKKFEQILDENRKQKLDNLKDFLSKNEYSDLFKTIAESNINYDYYYNKELYPFGYYGYNNLIHHKDLPENFYAFRDEIDYNNEDLRGVMPYNRFLFNHFNNLALNKFYETATHNVVFDNQSVVYNLEKLHLMDSLVSNENIKNHLLKYTTRDFVTVSRDSTETLEVVNSFLAKSTNDLDKAYIKDWAKSVNKLKAGNKIPNVQLLNYDNAVVDIHSIIKKPTVIYFWSSNLPLLLRNSHYKANSLKAKFPKFDFIAININLDDSSHWKDILKQYKLSALNEYHFKEPNVAMNELAISSVNKSILVDSEGIIINSNAMIFTSEFEEELERVLNKKEANQ